MRYSFYIINFSYVTYFNFHNVIVIFQDLIYGTTTIAVASFRAILDQVLKKLDLTYMGREPFFIRGLKFQAKLTFYTSNQFNTLLFDIYSCECEYIIRKRRRVHSSMLQLILMKFQAGQLVILTIFHIYRSGLEYYKIYNMHGCTLPFSYGFEHLL